MGRIVDDAEAVVLHRDKKWPVSRIAALFNVKNPAIYRAFTRSGYAPHGLYVLRGGKKEFIRPKFPKQNAKAGYNSPQAAANMRNYEAEEAALDARRIPPRDPCPRCGVRADIGCLHSTKRIGWHVG